MKGGKRTYFIVLAAVAALLTVSCRPKNVPSPKAMEDLLVDLHFTDGVLTESGMLFGHDPEMKGYYSAVLAKHGLTQEQFDTAIVWYTRNSVKFEKIYPKVQARLEKRLAAANGPTMMDGAAMVREVKPLEQVMDEYLHGLENKWPERPEPYQVSPILQPGM